MRSEVVWRLLPLILGCLLVAAQAEGSPPRNTARNTNYINPKNYQWVQIMISVNSTSCSALPGFDDKFREAYKADVVQYLNDWAKNPGPIITSIGDNGAIKACEDTSYLGVSYANYRAALRFRFTNTTLLRDQLRSASIEGICRGRYSQGVYGNIRKLMTDNGLTVAFNNGTRQSPQLKGNTNWIPVMSPSRCIKAGAIASPSPVPTIPSPSPASQVDTSSPAPSSCTSIPNSEPAADGTCKCTKPGYTREGRDGNKLMTCIDSSYSMCPAPYSTMVRDNTTPVPIIIACITQTTPCPDLYPFPLYGENQLRDECRPKPSDCTYTPYTMKITDINETQLVGCVNPNFNVCPFVAFREASNGWQMDKCKKTDFCPTYSQQAPIAGITNSRYTTAARAADRTLTACLTLDLNGNNMCPQILTPFSVNFPVEVVDGTPTSCGAPSAPCEFGATGSTDAFSKTFVKECLAFGGDCNEAKFPLRMFNNPGGGRPIVVGCREARPGVGVCDFTTSAMGTVARDPNAADYTIPVYQTQGNLVGCLVKNATSCPAAYPIAARDSSGLGLSECRQFTDSKNPCGGNTLQPVPIMAADGTWLGICVERKQTCEGLYANQYGTPVTIRNQLGEMIQCRAALTKCPTTPVLNTDGVSTLIPSFPMYKVNSALKTAIASCYPTSAIGSACVIDQDSVSYRIPIRSAAAPGTLLGCIANGTSSCPVDYPFAYMRCNTLLSCAPFNDKSVCDAGLTPLTFNQGTLVGCLDLTCSSPKKCPTLFPTTVATGINQDALECMAENSRCYLSTQPFSLFEEKTVGTAKFLELTWCINPQQSITDCSQADPALSPNASVADAWRTAAEVYSNSGTSVIGCIKLPTPNNTASLTSCPSEFPFIFKRLSGSTFQCRSGISPAPTCAMAVFGATQPPGISDYSFPVLSGSTLVGCTERGAPTCASDNVIVSETAYSLAESCLVGTLSSCSGVTTSGGQPRPFPIFSGVKADGTAKLVRCIAQVTASDCLSAATDSPDTTQPSYNVPIFASPTATGSVVGCVRASAETPTAPTPCPTSHPFYLVNQGPNSPLVACFPSSGACNITAYPTYTIPMTLSGPSTTQGCMFNGGGSINVTACPNTPPTTPLSPYTVPFAIRDAAGFVTECRQQQVGLTSCDSANFGTATTAIVSSTSLNDTNIIGCIVPGTFPAKCVLSAYPVAFYNAANQQVQCRPASVQCSPLGSGGFEVRYTTNGVLDACVDISPPRRRSRQLLGTGNVNGSTNGCSQVLAPRLAFWASGSFLAECAAGYNISSCNSLPSGALSTSYANYTVELSYSNFDSSTVEGCLAADASFCPNQTIATPGTGTVSYPRNTNTQPGVLFSCFEQPACTGGPCGNATFANCAESTTPAGYTCNVIDPSFVNTAATSIVSRFADERCAAASGTSGVLAGCKGDSSQLWLFKNDSTIVLYGTNNCLTATVNSTAETAVRVESCDTAKNGTTYDQYWLSESATGGFRFKPKSASTLCLQAVSNSGAYNLVTANCTASPPASSPQVFRANLNIN